MAPRGWPLSRDRLADLPVDWLRLLVADVRRLDRHRQNLISASPVNWSKTKLMKKNPKNRKFSTSTP
jgi:hypothetical protein